MKDKKWADHSPGLSSNQNTKFPKQTGTSVIKVRGSLIVTLITC